MTERSQAWSMVNWALISSNVKQETTISPNHATIDEAIQILEKKYDEMQLLLMEAYDLEHLLAETIKELLYQRHGKDIKKNLANRERGRKVKAQQMKNSQFDVKVVPFGNMKDMGIDMDKIDPETLEKLSSSLMDQLFGKKKKKKDDEDEDEDDDPGASFYL